MLALTEVARAVATGAAADAIASLTYLPSTWRVMPPVCPTARAVIHSSTFQMVVVAAVGVYRPATVVALAIVPGVGSMPTAKMNVAAAVLAMVPHAFRYTAFPGPDAGGFMKYP